MPFETYDELNDQFMVLYGAGDYAGALDLYNREGEKFPEREAEVLYLRSCMAARTGNNDQAISLIQEALDRGYWYGEHIMRRSPSWEPLQGVEEFESLVLECKSRQDQATSAASLLVLEPEGGCTEAKPCPAIVALHGNASTGQTALDGWAPVVQQGFLLASVQSSQAGMSNAYIWDDQETALRDIADQYKTLKAEHHIDAEQVIIAGFSLGAETALLAALRGTIPARGFILLGPGGPLTDVPDEWLPIIEQAKGRDLRGYVFIGEIDNDIVADDVRKVVAMLNDHGIPCELEVLPNLRHAYPPDWTDGLKKAIPFVLRGTS